MDNVASYFNKSNNVFLPTRLIVDNSRPVGVEIELERAANLYNYAFTDWYLGEDGSLKHEGVELKFREPLCGKKIINALLDYERALRYLKNTGYQLPVVSDRCSTHIHISVTDFSLSSLINLIDNFMLLEPLFFKIGNPIYNRKLNNNCLPLSKQDSQFNNPSFGTYFSNPKYSSINLNQKFGSAEVRVFNASLSFTQILQWINVLLEFFSFSIDNNLVKEGGSVYLKRIFPKMYHYIQAFLPVTYNYKFINDRSKYLDEIKHFKEHDEYIHEEQDAHPLTSILLEKGLL